MTLRIYAPNPTEGPPFDVALDLTCDGDHGFLEPTKAQFDCGWYPDATSAARQAGWKLTSGCHLGPCCSGKAQQ